MNANCGSGTLHIFSLILIKVQATTELSNLMVGEAK